MAEIVLQFSAEDTPESVLIRHVSHSPFSHVDAVLPDGSLLGAYDSIFETRVLSGRSRGVAIRPPDYRKFSYVRRARVVPTFGSTAAAVTVFYDALQTQLGKPYDVEAVLAFLQPWGKPDRDWANPDKWFCSELIAWALKRSVIPYELIVPCNRISPADLVLVINPYVQASQFWAAH